MGAHITILVTASQQNNHQHGYSICRHCGDNAPMENRIRELRTSRGLSLNRLEEMTGISAQQLNRLEKGERRLNEDNVRAIADALGYPLKDLIAATDRVPIVGEVGAGGEVYPIDDIPLMPHAVDQADEDYVNCEWVEAPPGIYPSGIVAVRVTGNSMLPFMPPGTIVYYAERFDGGAPDHCLSSLCVVQMRDERTLLKMVRKGQLHGKFDLVSYNMETITDVELAWCAPVVFIKPFLRAGC